MEGKPNDAGNEGKDSIGARRQESQGQRGNAPVLPLWWSRKEACEAMGISARTLTNYVRRGLVERKRVGRESRYRPLGQDVGNWSQSQLGQRQGALVEATTKERHVGKEASGVPPKAPVAGHLEALLLEKLLEAQRECGRLEQRVVHLEAELALRPRRRRVTS